MMPALMPYGNTSVPNNVPTLSVINPAAVNAFIDIYNFQQDCGLSQHPICPVTPASLSRLAAEGRGCHSSFRPLLFATRSPVQERGAGLSTPTAAEGAPLPITLEEQILIGGKVHSNSGRTGMS